MISMIIMDDLGYGDLGSYGVPDAKTPNIDRLARERSTPSPRDLNGFGVVDSVFVNRPGVRSAIFPCRSAAVILRRCL